MDWTHYLQSIREDPKLSPLREFYTITTVEGRSPQQKVLNAAPLLFDFGLMVERVEEKQDQEGQEQERKQVERLGVLEGLRKYAKDHVLLQGKPGSGKSTALKRLLLEEAETDNHIPVLIELKFYEESIVGLIREFLGRHGANLSNAAITEALANGEFLLLVDGVNELPSEAARRDLETVRSRYQKSTAMIFTTRDLGLGGNLGIEKKLEMLPLSESQMREFVCAYLPETGEAMLGTLRDRLREFGKTPLLLKMLCDLYVAAGTIPENLGLIFRAFTTQYENHPELKGKVPLGVSSKSFWGDLLQEIAFRMMQGADDPKEIAVAIPKSEAVKIIWDFCKAANLPNSLGDARRWLEDLLAYHLIELEGRDQITFCHQLIQEYYAAEKLLGLLPELDDESLKWDYLNYLKWTESIKLICALIDSEQQANQLVSWGLEIDYQLGAKLAGSVKIPFQNSTIIQIIDLDLNDILKINLLKSTHSEIAVEVLIKALSDSNKSVRNRAAEALSEMSPEVTEKALIQALSEFNFDEYITWRIASVLRQSSLKVALKDLIKVFYKYDNFSLKCTVKKSGKISSNLAVQDLIKALSDSDYGVREDAAKALGEIGSDVAIKALIKALSDSDYGVRWAAVKALGEIGSDVAVKDLIKVLSDSAKFVRWAAAKALGEIGSDVAVAALIKTLSDSDHDVRGDAAEALGKIGSNVAVEALIKTLFNSDKSVRCKAAEALGKIGSDVAIESLIKALFNSDKSVRCKAAEVLGRIGSDVAIKSLMKALLDSDESVRINAAEALGRIGSDRAVEALQNELKNNYSDEVLKALLQAQDKLKLYRAMPMMVTSTSDFIILTALADEFNSFKNCLNCEWVEAVDQNGWLSLILCVPRC